MDVVEVTNVSKKFKDRRKEFFAVKDASFSVSKGEVFGLLGPNGAGKTTLLNMVVGILVPDSGSVKVFGKNTQQDRDVLEEVSFASGDAHFHWAMRTKDVLNFYARLYGIPKGEREKRIESLVRFFGLQKVLYSKFGYLSTGERMRLIFSKALLNKPKLLLLDEPTLGLDPDIAIKVRAEIRRINRKFGTTILLTSHYMNEVEQLADRIAFINEGRIVDIGTIKKLKLRQFSTYDIFVKVKKIKERKFLETHGFRIRGRTLHKKMGLDENISSILSLLSKKGLEITDVESKKPTLEDYFVKIAGGKNENV